MKWLPLAGSSPCACVTKLAVAAAALCMAAFSWGACPQCTTFAPGVAWGQTSINGLTEASGIAGSRRNSGVLWVHNDGARQNIYAISTNGARLATFDLTRSVDDTEDIAVGPGPAPAVSYVYMGDIGGSKGTNGVRADVKILRMPEPIVDLAWANNPHSANFDGVESFTLAYPDGSYDAETLLVDPISGDVLVGTKQDGVTRLYRANLNALPDKGTATMEFVVAVPFSLASGGDISQDGTQIVLRREDFAMAWGRCTNETIASALSSAGTQIPVIGPPTEPNGEGIGLLPDGTGYVTISEGKDPVIYYFQAQCPMAPRTTLAPTNLSVFVGGRAEFRTIAVGFPAPQYQWRLNNSPLANETNASLMLTNLSLAQAGQYSVIASNVNGMLTNNATLIVRAKPDLRITEVMSSEAASPGVSTADWWELTSFESQPVDLSGWRFNDNSGGLTDPYVLPAGLTIGPGESIVFVEGLTVTQFTNWWGGSNLPPTVQIVSYSGAGLSLGASGDGLRLWNAQTLDTSDTIASVDFGAADAGVSFNYDPMAGVFGGKSQLGVNGVIRAASASDIGSPGRIRMPAVSPRLAVALIAGGKIRVQFEAFAGYRYSLQTRSDFDGTAWEFTGDTFQPTVNGPVFFETAIAAASQFFRVVVE